MQFRPTPSLAALAVAALAAAGSALFGAGFAAAEQKALTVVELFTSQGCNSCPPADELLGDLAQRPDILALSFHVNYWDYLGWKDTLATDATTDRQRIYASFLGERSVYTPQLVIGGVQHEVGSRRARIEATIARVAEDGHATVEVSAVPDGSGNLHVRIAGGELHQRDVVVWLVRFDKSQEVAIERGENKGRTLVYHNVVRDYTQVGMWYGTVMDLYLELAKLREGGRDGTAILVQENGSGRIIGALALDLDLDTI